MGFVGEGRNFQRQVECRVSYVDGGQESGQRKESQVWYKGLGYRLNCVPHKSC